MNTQSSPNQRPLRFLFCTWEGGGNLPPVLTLAQKLLRRGHRVRLMSDECNRPDAATFGIGFAPWTAAPSRRERSRASCPVRDWECTQPHEGIHRMMDKIMFGPALDYAKDVLTELGREPADLVVTSEMLPGVMAACEGIGQRCAVFCANLCFYPLDGMPAFGPGLPPPIDAAEAAIHEEIRAAGRNAFDRGLPSLNRARASLGLSPLASAVDQIEAAATVLLGTAESFDFPSTTRPSSVSYIGPQMAEPAWSGNWSSPWPETDRRPLVLAGFSTTFQNHASCLQAVIDAASQLPIRLLVTLGDLDSAELQPGENTVLVPSAPHDAVMREATAVITHGGHGTVMRALLHRRPMLILPHGRDQGENAIRVTERAAGLSLPATATVNEIRMAIHRLISEPSFSDAAQQLGIAIEQETQDARPEELLESLANPDPADKESESPPSNEGSLMAPLMTAMATVLFLILGLTPQGQANEAAQPDPVRGEYLVRKVAMCGDCHSPRNERGEFIESAWLFGAPLGFTPTVPMPEWATVGPPIAGLPTYTVEQAITLLTTGTGREGKALRPPMPHFQMSPQDARDVVAYLKSIGPVAAPVGQ